MESFSLSAMAVIDSSRKRIGIKPVDILEVYEMVIFSILLSLNVVLCKVPELSDYFIPLDFKLGCLFYPKKSLPMIDTSHRSNPLQEEDTSSTEIKVMGMEHVIGNLDKQKPYFLF